MRRPAGRDVYLRSNTSNMRKNAALAVSPEPQALELVNTIINSCADAKGRDITVLDVSKVFGMADFFVVVSGRSDRQVQGIANRVLGGLDKPHAQIASIEGMDTGHWVLIDCGEVIVHIFYEPLRAHYDIESLWANAKRINIKTRKTVGGPELRAC